MKSGSLRAAPFQHAFVNASVRRPTEACLTRLFEILRRKTRSGLWNNTLRVATLPIMWRKTARQLLVLVLSVALATGLVVRTVQAAQMDVVAATTSADMPMHGKCDGCAGSEKAMPAAACAASFCSMAVLVPMTAVFPSAPAGVLEPATELASTGRAFAPDPYPPRRLS
jgi:hypothetical protein